MLTCVSMDVSGERVSEQGRASTDDPFYKNLEVCYAPEAFPGVVCLLFRDKTFLYLSLPADIFQQLKSTPLDLSSPSMQLIKERVQGHSDLKQTCYEGEPERVRAVVAEVRQEPFFCSAFEVPRGRPGMERWVVNHYKPKDGPER